MRHTVDLVIELLALGGVGDLAVLLIAGLNLVEIGSFFHGVAGAELLCALKHKVLKIVS